MPKLRLKPVVLPVDTVIYQCIVNIEIGFNVNENPRAYANKVLACAKRYTGWWHDTNASEPMPSGSDFEYTFLYRIGFDGSERSLRSTLHSFCADVKTILGLRLLSINITEHEQD